MTNEELKPAIAELLPSATFDESGEWLTVNINAGDLPSFALQLRNEDRFYFDYLFCETCIDWVKHLTMVYHLTSTKHRHTVVLKAPLDAAVPEIATVSHIWKTAELHEREIFEMFGVNFLHHPDLRLLILPEGWEGKNPMRKNFEDPVNMIKL